MYMKSWLDSLRERNQSQDVDMDRRMTLEWILGKCGIMWTGCIWLSIRTDGFS